MAMSNPKSNFVLKEYAFYIFTIPRHGDKVGFDIYSLRNIKTHYISVKDYAYD